MAQELPQLGGSYTRDKDGKLIKSTPSKPASNTPSKPAKGA